MPVTGVASVKPTMPVMCTVAADTPTVPRPLLVTTRPTTVPIGTVSTIVTVVVWFSCAATPRALAVPPGPLAATL